MVVKTRSDKSRHWRPWLLGIILGVGGTAVIGIVLINARTYDIPIAARNVEAAADRYRAAGFPWEAEDVATIPPVLAAENAAPLIDRATKRANQSTIYKRVAEAKKLCLSKKYEEALAALAPTRSVYQLLDEALARPRFSSVSDLDNPDYVFLGMGRSSLTELVGQFAEVWIYLGEFDRAAAHLKILFRLETLFAQDGQSMTMSPMEACGEVATDVAVKYIQAAHGDRAALAHLATIMDQWVPHVDHDLIMRRQIYSNLALLRQSRPSDDQIVPLPDGEGVDDAPVQRTGLPRSVIGRGLATRFFEMWVAAKPIIDRTSNDPGRCQSELNRLMGEFQERPEKSYRDNMYLDEYLSSFYTEQRAKARRITVRALLAALIYKTKTGELPERVSDLPGRWIDPYTGEPLRIGKTQAEFWIYSVGPNKIDDGGYVSTKKAPPDDVYAIFRNSSTLAQ